MKRNSVFIFFTAALFFISVMAWASDCIPVTQSKGISPDTLDNQILFNGKIWRNLYGRIKGHQFLFTGEFLPGTVTIGPRTFSGVNLKYDIYKDELIVLTDIGLMLQLNKEIVDSFSFDYAGRIFNFLRMSSDTLKNPGGYVNILAGGRTSLLVKYRKKILFLASDNEYDLFDQYLKIYLMKDGEPYVVSSRKDMLRLMDDHRQEIKDFIREKKLRMTRKNPDSFIPVVRYYNDLQKN